MPSSCKREQPVSGGGVDSKMQPVRTTPPAKAIKTERTHEENQERAYIAASRRSDRSLEARVESARRASEIHKRRTGRSLRVTEQDVINEEMYEEEDDDLPLQYRRLTAHLQTGSADFNRRLAAYLTNQLAMRSAMQQMVQNSYAQAYSGQFTQQQQQHQNMFPSPMLPPQNMGQSPQSLYRTSPYPNPHHPSFRTNQGRALSMASGTTQQHSGSTSPNTSTTTAQQPPDTLSQRRMSTPATINPGEVQSESNYMHQPQQSAGFQPYSSPNVFPPLWQDMGPLTTSLPPESQQMLANAPGFDPTDPSYSMLMQGSDQYISTPYYPWHDGVHGVDGGIKGMPVHPLNYPSMSVTVAPSALEQNNFLSAANRNKDQPSSNNSTDATPQRPVNQPPTPGAASAAAAAHDFSFGQDSKGFAFGSGGSGQDTPAGEGFWDHFVMDESWDDGSSAADMQSSGLVANPSPQGVEPTG
ncbi:hypothetical protein PV08_10933 [Exophiala spinifera]|uniref:Uncharacterized protein n=1 Tax=Exophiala spinifera TaxID=91928 RepID=A0A0D1Y9G2_9EURO|nr:uncharacterized protein PV08_10933 [Exophiala spinifera]KIW11631.1 hypothetical protein PV08_10933 [Exophiala spinifera]